MRSFHLNLILLLFFFWSCDRWDYPDESNPVSQSFPETYISLVAVDTIYASIDSVAIGNDPITGEEIRDTVWTYAIGSEPDTGMVWDTLTSAFTTITTSRQELHWWGEDMDGNVLGYKYRWSSDTAWTYTTLESGVFFVPIRTDLDVFSFEVKAVDNDGNEDASSARLTLPITNSAPTIGFRYLSNPKIADIGGDTSFTFPTRTFIWDLYDLDGNETITDIFYALDDTCYTCWQRLEGDISGITLTELEIGTHVFYLKCRDIAGAVSSIISFPDSTIIDEAQVWKVLPVQGDVLIVDDFPLDAQNNALEWYTTIFDTIVGPEGYSVWEIGDELPYSATDVSANLKYFKHVIWFAAYNNTSSANDTYNSAEASLVNFIMGGGNLFINPIDFSDTTFTWFPMDSLVTLNPSGRLFPGRVIECPFDSTLDLSISHLIAVKVKGHFPNESESGDDYPRFFTNEFYHMADPQGSDGWTGNPTVCSIGQYNLSSTELSGKVVIMTLPLHDGIRPKLDGNGSSIKIFQYLFEQEFIE